MSIKILDNTATNGLGINANHEAKVALTSTASLSGFASLVSEKGVDLLSNRYTRELEVSEDYRLRVENDNLIFADYPTGTALNTSIWTAPVTTQTVTVGSNRYELNSSNITTVSTGSMLRTRRTFSWYKAHATYIECALTWTAIPVANWFAEWGLFTSSSAIAAITDGVFFRITAGQFRGVIVNNSVESHVDLGALPDPAVVNNFIVEITQDIVYFWNESVLLGTIAVPNTQYGPLGLAQSYLAVRTYNAGIAPATAIKVQVSALGVSIGGAGFNRLWPTVMSGMGGGSYQVPTGGTPAQTAAYANGVAPTTRALSATTKMETGLGGMSAFAAYAGSEVDYNLFGYQVPVGNTLYVRGVRIETANLGAAVATSASLFQWAVGVGSTADTLAGTESATVKIRRVIPLGYQSLDMAAPIGTIASPVDINFDAPLCIQSGEWFQIIFRMPVGAATASEVYRVLAMVNGYFE